MTEERRPSTIRLPASAQEDATKGPSSRTHLNNSTATASTTQHDNAMDADDTASTLYGESETASTIRAEKAPLHSGHYLPDSISGPSSQYRPQRTPGRKAFVGACEVVNTFIPIDIDHEATTMENSHITRLKRKFKGRAKAGDRNWSIDGDGTESVMSSQASTIKA